jgi:hypothetical protein
MTSVLWEASTRTGTLAMIKKGYRLPASALSSAPRLSIGSINNKTAPISKHRRLRLTL